LPGVTHIVVLEGLNDICFPGAKMDEEYLADPDEMRTVQDITDALRSKEKVAPTSSVHSATLEYFRAVKSDSTTRPTVPVPSIATQVAPTTRPTVVVRLLRTVQAITTRPPV